METLILKRNKYEKKQTLGYINTKAGKMFTLELPDLNNQRRISCIPLGEYEVVRRYSEKFGYHYHVLNVPGRDSILIHTGNYHSQILGCILVGTKLADINGDGYLDVTNSAIALKKMLETYPDGFKLIIENE
jgi:hypothetical protein